MTDKDFFDTFNRIHNPDYYYGKQKTKEKKTEKKKNTRKGELKTKFQETAPKSSTLRKVTRKL